ncbi:N-acetylmuramoyl-L-alanine amidase [Litorimonas taeanensis]|uniref:N-acetylmuramoyl-L-alanine amidase n=1 Tax=Litorimonas taeanensis TaxID=568099 RepID=A0A420WK11_9PROT|nr:N-acetylmuramoyl-L-alanine amidase [Litorimonas taeanensis]RKQ71262.1 N-acetylmuramoyl-L-alanine amidase [Litorimonas taeanensis]
MNAPLKLFFFAIMALFLVSSPTFANPTAVPRLKPNLKTVAPPAKPAVTVRYTSQRYFSDSVPYPRLAPHLSEKTTRKPVIFIDAGHGGRDPGAIGIKGTHEKDITTKASATLKALLEKTGRYTVVLTRPNDSYLEHEKRLRLAREGGADLFISIHADSAGNKSAKGASVYTLADRAKNRSKRLVSNSQNWIMDVDLSKQSDPVGDILVDLAQRKTESQSEQFANLLIAELEKTTTLVGNSHRRAGYFVLLAPDVPAVLLELGFLSNAQDEKLLNKASHREKLMRSVVRSIDQYFSQEQK